jgi:hypothetical protein
MARGVAAEEMGERVFMVYLVWGERCNAEKPKFIAGNGDAAKR